MIFHKYTPTHTHPGEKVNMCGSKPGVRCVKWLDSRFFFITIYTLRESEPNPNPDPNPNLERVSLVHKSAREVKNIAGMEYKFPHAAFAR